MPDEGDPPVSEPAAVVGPNATGDDVDQTIGKEVKIRKTRARQRQFRDQEIGARKRGLYVRPYACERAWGIGPAVQEHDQMVGSWTLEQMEANSG
jgi:hypothetical protein